MLHNTAQNYQNNNMQSLKTSRQIIKRFMTCWKAAKYCSITVHIELQCCLATGKLLVCTVIMTK